MLCLAEVTTHVCFHLALPGHKSHHIPYIILNNGILNLHSSVLPSSEVYISQYTPEGVYKLIGNEINVVIIGIRIV